MVPLLAALPLLAPGSETTPRRPGRWAARGRLDRRRDRADRRGRPLPAQSVLPPARADRLARGDDGGGAAGRARRGADRCRRPACRWRSARSWPACCSPNRTTATSSKPTSSRSAACCSPLFFMGIGMSIDMRIVRADLVADPRRRGRRHRAQGGDRLAPVPRDLRARRATRCAPDRCSPPPANSPSCCIPLGGALARARPRQLSLLTAIAAMTMLLGPLVAALDRRAAAPPGASRRAGARRFQRRARLGADHRLRPLRPDRVAMPARRGHRRHHHRQRSRDDRERRPASASRSITATARGSTCCAPPAPGERGWSRSASTIRETANRIVDLVRAEFPGHQALCALLSTAAIRLQLIAKGVDFELRETFESALVFGREALEALGLDAERAARGRGRSCASAISSASPLQQAEGIYRPASTFADANRCTEPLSAPTREVSRSIRKRRRSSNASAAGLRPTSLLCHRIFGRRTGFHP